MLSPLARYSVLFLLAAAGAAAQESTTSIPAPEPADPSLQIELFADEPLIQQPIGMTFDKEGRLLVIESHTHFRPKDWKGPEHDQIVWLRDSDGDGKADKREVIFEDSDMTMDIATHPDGSIFVSTRDEVLRLSDQDAGGKPRKVERKIIFLESDGRYPHNGLSGLAFDLKGGVYVGMGENLGAAYTLNGADGTSYKDQGEGGNVWHFAKNGSRLMRVATGFWNPFGVCVDPWGNVFATDNDPGSRPPCRLHHVVEGGDYGYQFRYGRSGLHPFVSWNGQRLGTLPMMAATGEAPCDVICYTPPATEKFRGLPDAWHRSLLVASWVDHRIESYQLTPADATFRAEQKILCQGGADFRPVAFAVAADGSIYVSDWVKRDYELHGFGRVWRISSKEPRNLAASPVNPYPRTRMSELRDNILHGEPPTLGDGMQGLTFPQPYLFSAVVQRLSHEALLVKDLMRQPLADGRQRGGLLLAARLGVEREGITADNLPEDVSFLLGKALSDNDPRVVLLALHWISDDRVKVHRAKIEHMLDDPLLTPELFYSAITALVRLDSKDAAEADLVTRLKKSITDPGAKPSRRRLALDILPDRDANLKVAEIEPIIAAAAPEERPWFVHLLGLMREPSRQDVLRKLALDAAQPPSVRAAAIAHLDVTTADAAAVVEITKSGDIELRKAALQSLQGVQLSADQTAALRAIDGFGLKPLAARLTGGMHYGAQRPVDFANIKAWNAYLHNLPGDADIANGLRVFASPRLGSCTSCHRCDGLGSDAGPNLTHISEASEPTYILESLLQPNRNVAPQWETFVITTTDGQTRTGFELAERESKHTYADLTGKTFDIKIEDIVKRERLPASIMPEGLVTRLTDEEVRDLLAFLSQRK